MFAPKVAKPQTKAAAVSTNGLAHRRSALAARRFGDSAAGDHEQDADLESMSVREAPRGLAWDFSKISIYPPDRPTRPQARSSFSAPLPGVLQPKLAVGAINDPLEREADAVAEQVMRMPDPALSISAASPQISRKCAACEEDEKGKTLQTKPAGTARSVGEAPSVVHEVLRSPGQPLDAATRAFFEPRFGRDFSQVRAHADAKAVLSARSVNGLAYTVGRHVVFGRDQYSPGTERGQRLLAHELTHVLQQASGHAPSRSEKAAEQEAEANSRGLNSGRPLTFTERPLEIARANDSSSVVITPTTGPNVCSLENGRHIQAAANQALVWLDNAISALGSYMVAPGSSAVSGATKALDRHFHSTTTVTAGAVRGRLASIKTDMTGRINLSVQCHDDSDKVCGASGAYVSGATMVFCPKFFESNDDVNWQSKVIVHETAHALVGGPHITDLAYLSDRLYRQLSTPDALANADSYALLVAEIGTGRSMESTAPTDTFEDCPEDWKPLIRDAIARAQRWNRNAQISTQDRRPTWLSGWADLQTRYLGSTAPAALDRAQKVYDKLEDALGSDIDFECEPHGGGRCASGSAVYWLEFWSDFHLCPAWKNQGTDLQRITLMLSGLYGYKGGESDAGWRRNYAMLAQDLSARFWKV